MQYRPPNANQEVSNTNQFGSISDNLGQLSAMASSRSPVCKNLSSKWDRFLPVRSQFDSNHRVNFSTPIYCQSVTFGPLAFCVCPLFFTTKIKNNFASTQLRFLVAIFTRQFSCRCRHRCLLKTAHDFARLRTTKHNSLIHIISFHGSRRFIFTGCCSATTGCCSASYI